MMKFEEKRALDPWQAPLLEEIDLVFVLDDVAANIGMGTDGNPGPATSA